jgi:hypothetical protein
MTVDHPRPPDGLGPDWTETVTGRAKATANAAVKIHGRQRLTLRSQ